MQIQPHAPGLAVRLQAAQRCLAKCKRTGKPCQQPAMSNGRCRLHGGKSTGAPKGNTNAATPGSLFSKYLTPEEQALYGTAELGSLDEEARLLRILLVRILAEETDMPKLDMVKVDGGVVYKRRDHYSLIIRALGRIGRLTLTRAQLLTGV